MSPSFIKDGWKVVSNKASSSITDSREERKRKKEGGTLEQICHLGIGFTKERREEFYKRGEEKKRRESRFAQRTKARKEDKRKMRVWEKERRLERRREEKAGLKMGETGEVK